jgi:hypothetical protein
VVSALLREFREFTPDGKNNPICSKISTLPNNDRKFISFFLFLFFLVVAISAIQLSLRNNSFKLKRTVKELAALRSVARLQQKYPRVSSDVLATVWNKSGQDYARADAELALLLKQLSLSQSGTAKKPRPKSQAFERNALGQSASAASSAYELHTNDNAYQEPPSRQYGSLGRPGGGPPPPPPASFRDAIIASRSATLPPPLSPRSNGGPESPRYGTQQQQQYQAPPSRSGTMNRSGHIRATDYDSDDDLEKLDFDRDLGAIAAGFGTTAAHASGGRLQARALFDYQADRDDKLSFYKGQIIDIKEAGDTAWWRGSTGGATGKFPKTYVRLMSVDIRARALYAFNDQSRAEHLLFDAGDDLVLLNKIPQSAWWEALLVKTNRVGIVPVNYCEITSSKEEFDRVNASS